MCGQELELWARVEWGAPHSTNCVFVNVFEHTVTVNNTNIKQY